MGMVFSLQFLMFKMSALMRMNFFVKFLSFKVRVTMGTIWFFNLKKILNLKSKWYLKILTDAHWLKQGFFSISGTKTSKFLIHSFLKKF